MLSAAKSATERVKNTIGWCSVLCLDGKGPSGQRGGLGGLIRHRMASGLRGAWRTIRNAISCVLRDRQRLRFTIDGIAMLIERGLVDG